MVVRTNRGIMICKDLILGILLLLLQSTFMYGIWEPSNTGRETVCRSEECLKRGELYYKNLNRTVKPCDDFYSFVCGAWYVQHRSPPHVEEWTVHDVIEKQLRQNLREILEEPVSRPDPNLMQVKYFYDICMKQPFYGRESPKKVARKIIKAGRFGKRSVWDIHHAYLKLTGESAFFDHRIYALYGRQLVPLLMVQKITSPYGAVLHGKWKPEEENNYERFLYLLITSLKLPQSNDNLRNKIKAVIKFRHQLNEIMWKSGKKGIMETKLMSAREFQQWFTRLAARGAKRSEMPWKKIIKTILSMIPKAMQNMQITRVQEEDYFRDLDKLLSFTSEEVLVDHMEIYFAERHTMFTATMEFFIEKTAIEPIDLVDYIREDVPRWETCIKNHNMWLQIGKILQEKWFKKNIAYTMTKLISDVKVAIASQVMDSSWLTDLTKVDTINMVLRVNSWIGYPPWYSNPSTDTHDEKMDDPMRAEAFMDLEDHVIFIKSPILQPPFFDPSLPNVYNYGAMGSIVGHELYHVICECGEYVNSNNTRVRWWPEGIHDECKTRMKCFTDAYNKKTEREFVLKYHEIIKRKERKSYLEDVPDVMGLDAAFRAYQTMQSREKSACQTLPHFEKYSCEQMFFISFANNMCGKMTKVAARYHIKTFQHSLASVRVNGAVQNNEFFQRAFQCAQSKPMNPPIKCNLWK